MKRKTIRNHKDFLTAPNDLMVRSDCFVLKVKPAKIVGDARYGIVVTKKMFKLAVQRNRAKRLLRDWIAFSENLMIPELDYIIIARSNILECNRDNGRALIFSAFKKIIGLYNNAKPR